MVCAAYPYLEVDMRLEIAHRGCLHHHHHTPNPTIKHHTLPSQHTITTISNHPHPNKFIPQHDTPCTHTHTTHTTSHTIDSRTDDDAVMSGMLCLCICGWLSVWWREACVTHVVWYVCVCLCAYSTIVEHAAVFVRACDVSGVSDDGAQHHPQHNAEQR